MVVIIYIAILGGICALLYELNRKTDVPEGCEQIKAECSGCKATFCANHPSHNQKEERSK